MIRFDAPAVHLLDLEKVVGQSGRSAYYSYTPPKGEGGPTSPRAGIALLQWNDGATAPWGKPYQFEYHTLHEEIFVLGGALNFNDLYTVQAPGYQNHPPFWMHPTNFWAVGDLTMLLRTDLDPVVQFEPIPIAWDGREHFARSKPTRCSGVTQLQIDDLPFVGLNLKTGGSTGLLAKRLWDDLDDGWTTWLMKVGPDWSSRGSRVAVEGGGDELYVIDGDLSVQWASATLHRSGYVCSARRFEDGDGVLSSHSGATFIRWTRGMEKAWDVKGALVS